MKPKLYILPAYAAPSLIERGVGLKARTSRIFDANGTEFVGLKECLVQPDPESPLGQIFTVSMQLQPGEYVLLDAPPDSLEDRLRAIVAKWRSHWAVATPQGADKESANFGAGIEGCADELEALLNGEALGL